MCTTNLFTVAATIRHAELNISNGSKAIIIFEGTRNYNFCHFGTSLDLQKRSDSNQLECIKKLANVNWLQDLKKTKLRAIVRYNAKNELEVLAVGYRNVDIFYVLNGDGNPTNEQGALKTIEQTLSLKEGLQ